ncbi:flagellar biosynthetic protein FliR [Candidatus Kapabacteria bacterium]|nr:flagellar biosynthetic protein FliR [Candidatus Kapabacteria bacterium]
MIFIRITGIFLTAPFLRSEAIPPHVKIMFSVILAIIVNSALWDQQPTLEFHLWNLVFIVFKEFLVGMLIGFAANTVFYAARMAGGLVDQDMGFQTATIFDRSNSTPTIVGEIKELAALLIFLFLNGHHYMIEGLFLSVKAIPLTTMEVTDSTMLLLAKMSTSVIILSIKMASPVLISLFLTNLSLALLARVAPQTNIFILSFQVKVTVGLIVLMTAMPLFIYVAKIALSGFQENLYTFIMTLYPDRVY